MDTDIVPFSTIAMELGIRVSELRRLATALGATEEVGATGLPMEAAETLKAILQGMAVASKITTEGEAARSTSLIQGRAPAPNVNSLMLVSMAAHDVHVSTGYEHGFNNMLKVVAALLSDPQQTIRTKDRTLPWGEIYFLRADHSTSKQGKIELEYGDDTVVKGVTQRDKGLLGDLWWSILWYSSSATRPIEKILMSAGAARDPESDFRNQLASDLLAWEAQGLISGLEEWEIKTSTLGRNIHIVPKPEFLPVRE